MSRNIKICLPPEDTEKILPRIKSIDGLLGLRVHKNISIQPKGDVLDFDVTNTQVSQCLKMLEEEGLLYRDDVAVSTSRPSSVISRASSGKVLSETHETSWEEMLKSLLYQSSMSLNYVLVMFSAGIVAAIGISTNALHTVVGAMLIAPGFEPISRTVLGLVARHRDWKNGAIDVVKAYALLVAGGFTGALIADLFLKDVLPGSASYLSTGALVDFWMSFSATSITVSIFSSFVGGIIIMTNKSILTAGVMVALALYRPQLS